jgi:signal transduction histidine kinase/ActR/RegA family two-component response regulator
MTHTSMSDKIRFSSLSTLLQVTQGLVQTLDLKRILQCTVDGAASLFEWGSAAIYLLDGEHFVRLQATYPPLPKDFSPELGVAELMSHPRMAMAIKTSKPVYVGDMLDKKLSDAERRVVEERHLRTLYFIPLLMDGKATGALIVGSTRERVTITEDVAAMAATLANFAALAIRNARLYEEKQLYIDQMEQTILKLEAERSAREILERELLQAQKLDAIGQLAGGIAHDFNNQLGGILGYAELLRLKLKDERMAEYAARVITLAQRSADLNSKLLAFTRKGLLRNVPVNVHQLIEEVVGILTHTISRGIVIQTSLNAEVAETMGDPTQIQNALLNLGLNARDAMGDSGVLQIETTTVHMSDVSNEAGSFVLEGGTYLQLSIRDTGCGIRPEVAARIFEPYFTTKSEGKGTGMGLAAVFGTMKMLNGAVDLESEPGEGSTFRLYFPVHQEASEKSDSGDNAGKKEISGRQILVIDDEDALREVFTEHLLAAGFVLHSYTDARKALTFFKTAYADISLVVLDMMMPEVSGTDMFYQLRDISPDIPVVVVSGFAEENRIQSLLDSGASEFLQKPFRAAELIRTVKNVLNRHPVE